MINLTKSAAIAISAFVLVPAMARANSDDPSTEQPLNVSPRIDSATRGPIEGVDRISGLGYDKLNTDAQLSSDDGTIVAHLSLDYSFSGKPVVTSTHEGNFVGSSFTNVSAKLAVPLNPSDKGSNLDFKTFGNQAKLTLNFNHFNATFAEPGTDYPLIYDFAATCVNEAGKTWLDDAITVAPDARLLQMSIFLREFRVAQYENLPVGAALDRAAKKVGAESFGAAALTACRPGKGLKIKNENVLGDLFAQQTLSVADYKTWRARNRGHDSIFYYGADVSVGYNRFTIANSITFIEDRVNKVGFDASFHAGLILPNWDTQVSIGGGYTRRFKSGAEVQLCSPPNLSGVTKCAKGLGSVPVASETGYVETTARKILLRRKDGTPLLAMAPSVSYIFEEKDFQAKLPVYFQRNEKGGLDAGVQAVWNNSTQNFAIGAFIGVPFGGY